MKKLVNILLSLCIIAMIYIVYDSIMGPIRFAQEKEIRDKAVIEKLLEIKAVQNEYNNLLRSGYCDNFDTLAAFIRTAQIPIVNRNGELTDDQLDHDWTESKVLTLYAKARSAEIEAERLTGRKAANKRIEADTLWQKAAKEGFIILHEDGTKEFLFSRETEFVSLYDSIFKGKVIDPDSLRYVPFGNGAMFELSVESDTSATDVVTHTFQAQTPFEAYLGASSYGGGLDRQELINLLEDCDDRGRYRGMRVDNNSGNWE